MDSSNATHQPVARSNGRLVVEEVAAIDDTIHVMIRG
jgi:hypothetical protein